MDVDDISWVGLALAQLRNNSEYDPNGFMMYRMRITSTRERFAD